MTQLATLISFMDSVSAGSVATLVVKPATKGTALLSLLADCTVQVNAPALTITGLEAPIAVDAKTLLGACKSREVTLAVKGQEILVKSGKSYSAAVACSEEAPQIPEGLSKLEDCVTSLELTPDNIMALKSALSATKIEKTYTGIVDTLVAVKATAKSITVLNYEPSQVSSITVKNASGFPDCFFVLPFTILSKALNLAGAVKILVNDSAAVFVSKSCLVRANLPIDTINAIDKSAVFDLVSSVKDINADAPNLVTTKETLDLFLNNAESLIAVGGDVSIEPSGATTIQATVSTVKGTVTEKFPGKAKKKFVLGYAFMRAIVSRAKPGVDIELRTTDAFAVVKTAHSTYIAALSEG